MSIPSKILIVDDDPIMRELLGESLAPLGYDLSFAEHGDQALDCLAAAQFDLLLLDLILPGASGLDILRHVEEHLPQTTVIMLTAQASLDTALETLRLGAYDFLLKPFSINILRSTVQRALEKQRLEKNISAIYDLSCEMALSLSVEQVGNTALDIINRVLGLDLCDIWLIDEEQECFYLLAARPSDIVDIRTLPLGGEKGIMAATLHGGAPVYVRDTQTDPRYIPVFGVNRSELAVPLQTGGQIIGVLDVESATPNAFTPADERMLSILAAQTATAIKNARLYEQAQQEIAERKQAESALRESEHRFREVLENVQLVSVMLDTAGRITFCNDSLLQLTGWQRDEILNQNWFDHFVPPELGVGQVFTDSLAQQTILAHYRNEIVTRSGERRLIAWNNTVLRDNQGRVIGTTSIGEDITERQQAEEVLRHSEERFRLLAENARDVIYRFQLAPHFVLEYVGPAVLELTGYTPEELYADLESSLAYILGQDRDQVYALVDGRGPLEAPITVRCAHKNGSSAWVELRNTLVYDTQGNPTAVEGIARNISERVDVEERIRRRTHELEVLNAVSRAITSTLNLDETLALITQYTIQLMNAEATSLILCDHECNDMWFAAGSGVGSDVILGQRMARGQGIVGWVVAHDQPLLVHDVTQDERWFSQMDQQSGFTTRSILCVPLRSKGRPIGAIEAINKQEGTFDQEDIWLLTSLAASAASAIENARLFEQVAAGQEQLRALSRRLVDMQEAERGHVARELHDETGQALSYLLLGLSLLEREANKPEAVIARANEMEGMIDEMLENLHRLAVNLRPAALDYLGLVPALEQYIDTFSRQHGIAVHFAHVGLDQRLAPAVETAFYRIVQEALTNVVRHARANRVDVLLERRDHQVVVVIEDDGVGCEPHAALQSGRLGLFGIQERAKMLDGRLMIESAPGQGTTVVVEVPDDNADSHC